MMFYIHNNLLVNAPSSTLYKCNSLNAQPVDGTLYISNSISTKRPTSYRTFEFSKVGISHVTNSRSYACEGHTHTKYGSMAVH